MKKLATIILRVIGAGLVAMGIFTKVLESTQISIIGGTDGPSAVFMAGSLGGDLSLMVTVSGIIVIGLSIFIGCKKTK